MNTYKDIILKPISPMEKCFLDESIEDKQRREQFSAFRGERLSLQIAYTTKKITRNVPKIRIRLEGSAAPYATVCEVVSIANAYPVHPTNREGEYLRTEAGLYPDLIQPLRYEGCIRLIHGQLRSLWVDIDMDESAPAGDYELTVVFESESAEMSSERVSVGISLLDTALPPQRLIHTEWFYTDCIAEAHKVEVFSEEHWTLIGKYLRMAVESGINMILTPIFTPELDTYIGGERLTTQLIGITVDAPNVYRFDTSRLERWIELCLSAGVKYFEIPHFFTQWGAEHAPKFIASVNGEEKRIFGWETDATSEEYKLFLSQLIPTVLDVFRARGLDKNCYFHVSDEPNVKHIDTYKRSKDIIAPYLEGYNVIDALSDFDFYSLGILKKPVPAIKHIKPFLENKVEGLWAYYCGASGNPAPTTDRFLSVPLARTRILGVQLYLARIEGFLHWGYNFYHNQNSYNVTDPYLSAHGDYFAPTGDAFLVYPGDDGPWSSIRLYAMRAAMDDLRALELCESVRGREFTEQLVRDAAGMDVSFFEYPCDNGFFERLRAAIADAVK